MSWMVGIDNLVMVDVDNDIDDDDALILITYWVKCLP